MDTVLTSLFRYNKYLLHTFFYLHFLQSNFVNKHTYLEAHYLQKKRENVFTNITEFLEATQKYSV